MVFSSILFLFFFLPALLACYFCLPRRLRAWRNGVLLAFSLLFYACGGLSYLPVLLCSIAVNYLCGLLAAPGRPRALRRAGLWGAAVLGLGLLGWFKYAGFLCANLSRLGVRLDLPQIVLPIGISFFTFQGLSYVIDVYRGDAPCQRNPFYVALYVALFPQLVAGPIVRYSTVAQEITGREETLSEFSHGTVRFLFGLGKKMLLANAMGEVADAVFAQSPAAMAAGTAWVGAAAYTLQIYFDFSAYSDMAIGLGRMFGFHFLENFNYPYISQSITEFWRRWHISLSSWFRDYVYIPLGGNRVSHRRHLCNLFAVWMLTGIWHGANWTFLLWGLGYFLLLMAEKYGQLDRRLGIWSRPWTLLWVLLLWVVFRADSLGHAGRYFSAMFTGGRGNCDDFLYYFGNLKAYLGIAVVCCLPVERAWERIPERVRGWLACGGEIALLLLVLTYVASSTYNPFIYFNF